MIKYYFDIRTASVVYEDLTGCHCADPRDAWQLAFDDARGLARAFSEELDECWVDVCDSSRRTLAMISLAAASKKRTLASR